MRTGTGPSFGDLRPFQTIDGRDPVEPGVFPVYDDLIGHLRKPASDPTSGEPDEVVAHVLSVLSTYAYSDLETLLEMATRLGLERCEGLAVELRNDPLFVVSTAYLVTSSDGSVGILVYRGTMPVDVINWLTDLDAAQEQVRLVGPDTEPLLVHAGFYRKRARHPVPRRRGARRRA